MNEPVGNTTYAENLLIDTLDRLRRDPESRKVVVLHLSQISPKHSSEQRLKIVSRMFKALESGMRAQVFMSLTHDLVVVCKDEAQRDVKNIVHNIRNLFGDDPLTFKEMPDHSDPFSTWYDLSREFLEAYNMATDLKRRAVKFQADQKKAQEKNAGPAPVMTPKDLEDIQQQIQQLNIVPFVTAQKVVNVSRTGATEIAFDEFFCAMGPIRDAIAPNCDIFKDRWLFQDLSRTLDLRILEALRTGPYLSGLKRFSLNLNLETVTTDKFRNFIHLLSEGQQAIIEVQVIDVLSNVGTYLEVRDTLSDAGHQLLIDGLSPVMLEMLDLKVMKPPLVKIIWAPEYAEGRTEDLARAAALVDELGGEKIILTRCDSEASLMWGMKVGITAFQGHLIDRMKTSNIRGLR